jgi:isoleucyl-tRNA synthetase
MTQPTTSELNIKETIDLPQTSFPMRGNGPVREPEFQKIWQEIDIYKLAREIRRSEQAEMFILHDGPPYLSSDKIHIGTALNKILKDIIVKYQYQRGFETPYVPGYDSHGLPIESAVVKKIKGGREAVSITKLRELCTEFALKNLKGQEEKFKRLGVVADWENPYVTLQPNYEARQLELFGLMADQGHIYRGLKAVHWSYGSQTALAEAEVEYVDDHISDSVYVKFAIDEESLTNLNDDKLKNELKGSSIVIWTTTPWTLPANLAISLHKNVDYLLVNSAEHGKMMIAVELFEDFQKQAKIEELNKVSKTFKGEKLAGLEAKHPFLKRNSKIIFGEHVSTESGTGCVHTAPGHGQEDFDVGKEYNLGVICPVDQKGFLTAEAGEIEQLDIKLAGLHIAKDANPTIIDALTKLGALVAHNKYKHSYPYCWRSKTPLLYRATEQWFASVDAFREQALSEIDKVTWYPGRARNRIYSMVESRGDWCISRQRVWGVPIPALYDTSVTDEYGNFKAILDLEIINHVSEIFKKEGSNAWYEKELTELIPQHLYHGENAKYQLENLKKETDTMDVWFDSGSSHRAVVFDRPDDYKMTDEFKPVEMYLEGSDQHRGWFQSSLLTSVAVNGFAPYKSVLTHGFVMDEKGRKMSKSLGNVVDPADVIKNNGADILRLWVASIDYSVDIKVGKNIFKQLSDIYRNFRNTSRFMLGNLFDFNPETDLVSYDKLWDLDRLILHRLQTLNQDLTKAFDNYELSRFYQLIQNFCTNDLSAFYFDICKDRLYTHGKNSLSRRAAQTVTLEILSSLSRFLVPVLSHLAEDLYTHMPEAVKRYLADHEFYNPELKLANKDYKKSILLANWPALKEQFIDDELASKWQDILELRDIANKELETLRAEKVIAKSLEAELTLEMPADKLKVFSELKAEIQASFMVSSLILKEADTLKISAGKFIEGKRCERCWKYFSELHEHGLCTTCLEAVKACAN